MKFGVLLWPNNRASTTAFVLALAFFAALDGLRIGLGLPAFWNFLVSLFVFWCVLSLHFNRRRHANKSTGIAFLPPTLAIIGSVLAGMGEVLGHMTEHMMEFAAANGVNPEDVEAFTAAVNDPAFISAWQDNLTANPDIYETWMPGVTWASYGGFWIVLAGFAIWFTRMKSAGGAMADLRATSVSHSEPVSSPPSSESAGSDPSEANSQSDLEDDQKNGETPTSDDSAVEDADEAPAGSADASSEDKPVDKS